MPLRACVCGRIPSCGDELVSMARAITCDNARPVLRQRDSGEGWLHPQAVQKNIFEILKMNRVSGNT